MDESMEKALRHISEQLKDEPEYDKNKLVEEASKRFDLSPLQSEFLINKYVLGL